MQSETKSKSLADVIKSIFTPRNAIVFTDGLGTVLAETHFALIHVLLRKGTGLLNIAVVIGVVLSCN
jgi:hypothetical protein